ncbi:Uncharacterised protein [Bordetella pertussis]|nr:Uncharacterised protein [Bordetella pertussis]
MGVRRTLPNAWASSPLVSSATGNGSLRVCAKFST